MPRWPLLLQSQKGAELVWKYPILLDACANEVQRQGDSMMAKWAEVMTNMRWVGMGAAGSLFVWGVQWLHGGQAGRGHDQHEVWGWGGLLSACARFCTISRFKIACSSTALNARAPIC